MYWSYTYVRSSPSGSKSAQSCSFVYRPAGGLPVGPASKRSENGVSSRQPVPLHVLPEASLLTHVVLKPSNAGASETPSRPGGAAGR